MIRLGICEDVYEEMIYCKKLVDRIMANLSRNAKVYSFQSGEDLLLEIDTTGNMDILLVDIELLGEMNGVEFARKLREKDNNAIMIFISSHDQYCKEVIDVQPYAFIDKPISAERLEEVLAHAIRTRLDQRECFCFSCKKTQFRVPLSEIRYFQSDKRLIYVWTTNSDAAASPYMFYGKLQKVEETVSRYKLKFLRLRKSFLVNVEFIVEYAADRVSLNDGTVIEISKNYKPAVREYYISSLKENIYILG